MKRSMRTAAWSVAAAALIAAAVGLLARPAAAQMAGALGKPLRVSDLEVGTVTVRVVDGSPANPLVGIDVQLVNPDDAGGAPRTARTDAEGRATFSQLEPGTRYVARASAPREEGPQGAEAQGGEDETATSEPFEVPESGGLRLLLSVSPWQMGPGAGAPGTPGMPDPRQMSGISRPQGGDPAGRLTVRVVQGKMSNNVADQPVHLVGYGADGSASVITRSTDAGGRAVFDGLVPGRVAYYAMTELPRQVGDQTVIDRVRSGVIIMLPEVGLRLLLAGEGATSGKPPVEDLERVELQDPNAEAGEVLVRLYGQVTGVGEIELARIREQGVAPEPVATAPVTSPEPHDVRGSVEDAVQMASLDEGAVAVTVTRNSGGRGMPVPRARVDIEPVPAPGAAPAAPAREEGAAQGAAAQLTGPEGVALVSGLTPGEQYRLVATVHGARIESAPFTMPRTGGMRLAVSTTWRDLSSAQARFEGVSVTPDGVYMARARAGGETYLSAPFQPSPDRGAAVRMVVLSGLEEPVGFAFHMQGWIDDVYMGFQSQMTLHNWSYAPWDPGPEGLVLPLPEGFVGAQVEDEMTHRVSVDSDRGFIWRGAVPPGGAKFMTAFSLPVSEGGISFDMPLPLGAMNSLLALRHTPGMEVEAPAAGTQGRYMEDNGGRRHYVVGGINIAPQKRMVLTVSGLPEPPVWQRYLAWAAGVVVLGLLAWGMLGIFAQRRREARAGAAGGAQDQETAARRRKLEKRREHLLDELVTLEAKKGDLSDDEHQKRRSKLTRQLEAVYMELDQIRTPQSGAPRPPA